MDRVFPALERKFKSNRQLVRWARKLYHGHGGEPLADVRAYVEVTCTGGDEEFSTFSTTEPRYDLVFTIFTKDSTGRRCGEIMGEVRETFKDCHLDSGLFDTVRMLQGTWDGPLLDQESGTYRATMAFSLHISLKVQVPAEALT